MSFDFFAAQRRAKGRTWLFLILFFLLAVAVAILIEVVYRYFQEPNQPPAPPFLSYLFLGVTFLIALFYYLAYSKSGGRFVAQALGGREVVASSTNLQEQQLLNIVAEMAIASGVKKPPIFIIEAKQINAFAAGMKQDNAAIAITRGALNQLNRDEVQGVIAHEFGHIYNGDMKISMRLAAMVMGFMIVFYIGSRLLMGSMLFGGRNRKGNNPTAAIGLAFLLAGAVTYLAGTILRATISREREYLADACAVQFTRNPQGIANALRKIGGINAKVHDMPPSGMAYSHLYFDNASFWGRLFATHPPLKKRIEAIEGGRYSLPPEGLNH